MQEYESLLLKCYQAFLKILINTAQTAQQNHHIILLRVAVKCLCGLAASLHHFNYGYALHQVVSEIYAEWI